MGWAKYYEDNVSICIDRMAVKESVPVVRTPVKNFRVIEHKQQQRKRVADQNAEKRVFIANPKKANGRRGLELFFITTPDAKMCRNLQMNGWWWSASKKSWCNLNIKANRKYAEETARKYQAKVTIVAE